MCGFAGQFIFSSDRVCRAELAQADKMADTLSHRGPDSRGAFASPDGRCAMAFRRLKIIDLESSEQPMSTSDGSVTMVFNGEIYNYIELRKSLSARGRTFYTNGDTEVLLAMYEHYGMDMLNKLQGMFAGAIYDSRSGELFLFRDRLGVKPLWYALGADRIVFASEAKAILACDKIDTEINRQGICSYAAFGYVPAPMSIWQNIHKLPPGSFMIADDVLKSPQYWWRPPTHIEPISVNDAIVCVREKLTDAVEKRLRSDVPLGILLSGGMDSSIVAAIAAEITSSPDSLRTFSAGFKESRFDERPFAREVANHIGSDHTELLIEPDPVMVDTVVENWDEPFGDSSAIATTLLCRLVRQHVTVALGGDGGDEAFGGYDRHRAMWIGEHISAPKAVGITALATLIDKFVSSDEKSRARRFVRFANGLNAPPALRYMAYRCQMDAAMINDLVCDDFVFATDLNSHIEWFVDQFDDGDFPSDLGAAQRCDMLTYLPDDLLVKADIASMTHGLELRSPMLDHHVIEFGLSLPDKLKVNKKSGKRILAKTFRDMLPKNVFNRPKSGFGVPLDSWLRNELQDTLKETLLDQSFTDLGWFKRTAVENLINSHVTGRADHRHRLWSLLILGRWASKYT